MKLLPVWARRLAARPIRRIPIRIRSGPNAGRRWSLAASGRGIAAGSWETERFEAFAALVRADDVVWDVGAHYGYATLIAGGAVGPRGTVVAFEPSTGNRWYLERHLRWNGMHDVRVLPCAVAEADRTDVFGGAGGSISFRLGREGEAVRVRSITSLAREGGRIAADPPPPHHALPFPTFIKMDVEGTEVLALEGARPVLEEARRRRELPTILLAVHDPDRLHACRDILADFEYEILASKRIARFESGDPWREDPDLLALPPNRTRDAAAIRRMPWFGP